MMEEPPPALKTEGCNSRDAAEKEPTFMPPLYIQRYSLVTRIMTKHNVKNVLDCGSAECKIMQLLKTVPTVERIALLDIDEELLNDHTHNARPLVLELVMPDRPQPLDVQVFAGDAGTLDSRLADFEAVSMVELIEHLHEGDLNRITENIFGKMQPRVVVITTPNSDYNKLFTLRSKFRHWDHKFEWTQEEFVNWCAGVCRRYGYEVKYSGVGNPPADSPECGFCSQAGIFIRLQDKTSKERGEECYKLVFESRFPAKKVVPKTVRITQEANTCISRLLEDCVYEYPETGECRKASTVGRFRLADIFDCCTVQELCTLPELRESLSTVYEVSKDGNFVYVPTRSDRYSDEEENKEEEEEDAGAFAADDDNSKESHLPIRDDDHGTDIPFHENWENDEN